MNQASILKAINLFSFKKKKIHFMIVPFFGARSGGSRKSGFLYFSDLLLIKLNVGGTL
jgi:hypothetical protein